MEWDYKVLYKDFRNDDLRKLNFKDLEQIESDRMKLNAYKVDPIKKKLLFKKRSLFYNVFPKS